MTLPKLQVQYPDYAVWQERTQQLWTDRHGAYWSNRLRDAARIKLPRDHPSAKATSAASAQIPIQFGTSLSAQFRELGRRNRTPLAICVLAAYVATILLRCQKSELVLGFIVLGRHRPEFQHMIGFLSHILYLRIELFDDDTFVTFLERVSKEYFTACHHQDFCRHAAGLPQYARNTNFNWISSHDRSVEMRQPGQYSSDYLTVKPFDYSKPAAQGELEDRAGILDTEPWVMLKDTAEGIGGTLRYRPQFFEASTMERFALDFRALATAFAESPNEQVKVASRALADDCMA